MATCEAPYPQKWPQWPSDPLMGQQPAGPAPPPADAITSCISNWKRRPRAPSALSIPGWLWWHRLPHRFVSCSHRSQKTSRDEHRRGAVQITRSCVEVKSSQTTRWGYGVPRHSLILLECPKPEQSRAAGVLMSRTPVRSGKTAPAG